jgi:hypothetical protein
MLIIILIAAYYLIPALVILGVQFIGFPLMSIKRTWFFIMLAILSYQYIPDEENFNIMIAYCCWCMACLRASLVKRKLEKLKIKNEANGKTTLSLNE